MNDPQKAIELLEEWINEETDYEDKVVLISTNAILKAIAKRRNKRALAFSFGGHKLHDKKI